VSATPTTATPVKTKDHSDNHNSGEDEGHSAKAAPAATDSVKGTKRLPREIPTRTLLTMMM
jgi:hypothetical protein